MITEITLTISNAEHIEFQWVNVCNLYISILWQVLCDFCILSALPWRCGISSSVCLSVCLSGSLLYSVSWRIIVYIKNLLHLSNRLHPTRPGKIKPNPTGVHQDSAGLVTVTSYIMLTKQPGSRTILSILVAVPPRSNSDTNCQRQYISCHKVPVLGPLTSVRMNRPVIFAGISLHACCPVHRFRRLRTISRQVL